jgi:hypothetical protein
VDEALEAASTLPSELEKLETEAKKIGGEAEHDVQLLLHRLHAKVDVIGGDLAKLLAVVEQVAAQAEQMGSMFGGGDSLLSKMLGKKLGGN